MRRTTFPLRGLPRTGPDLCPTDHPVPIGRLKRATRSSLDKFADFIVIDRDILAVRPGQIKDVRVAADPGAPPC